MMAFNLKDKSVLLVFLRMECEVYFKFWWILYFFLYSDKKMTLKSVWWVNLPHYWQYGLAHGWWWLACCDAVRWDEENKINWCKQQCGRPKMRMKAFEFGTHGYNYFTDTSSLSHQVPGVIHRKLCYFFSLLLVSSTGHMRIVEYAHIGMEAKRILTYFPIHYENTFENSAICAW